MKNKKEEFENFISTIKSELKNIKQIKNPILEERLFYIAKYINNLFLNKNYNYLFTKKFNNIPTLTIKLEYFFNHILKITISNYYESKVFKIQYDHNLIIENQGIIKTKTFNIFNKENSFETKYLIKIKNKELYLVNELTKLPICVNENKNITEVVLFKTGINLNEEDLDLMNINIEDNVLYYTFEYQYNNQLILPSEENYIFI